MTTIHGRTARDCPTCWGGGLLHVTDGRGGVTVLACHDCSGTGHYGRRRA